MEDKIFITAEIAKKLLVKGKQVHTFRNPQGILIGADVSRDTILKKLDQHDGKIEIGGDTCIGLKHAIIIDDNGYLFINNDENNLSKYLKSIK